MVGRTGTRRMARGGSRHGGWVWTTRAWAELKVQLTRRRPCGMFLRSSSFGSSTGAYAVPSPAGMQLILLAAGRIQDMQTPHDVPIFTEYISVTKHILLAAYCICKSASTSRVVSAMCIQRTLGPVRLVLLPPRSARLS